MTTDTDALLATVRELGIAHDQTPNCCQAHAALDSLAAELERVKAAFDLLGRSVVSTEEHERVKAENAYHARTIRLQQERTEAADVRAHRALSALREVEHGASLYDIPADVRVAEVHGIARAAIAEIEGEA